MDFSSVRQRAYELVKKELEIRQQICDIGKQIHASGMVVANDGNISVKLNENEVICTPTGISKGYMTPECLCKVDMKGNLIDSRDGYKPSSEMKMHLRVYEKRDDVNAVVHTHAPYATTFAIAGKPLNLPLGNEVVVALGEVPLADFALPSTEEVPNSIEKFLPYYDAVLLGNHGVITYGGDLMTAFMKMESVEMYARLTYQTMMIGGPRLLDNETIERLYELRRNNGWPGHHPATHGPVKL